MLPSRWTLHHYVALLDVVCAVAVAIGTVVLGAWCAMVPSMGMLNTIGILDAWIGENQLEALPKSQTAWIVSLYAFFLYIGGSFVGA